MPVDLLQHNIEAYEKIKKSIEDGKTKIAVANATGSGKSYIVAKLCEDYKDNKKLILVPSTYIREQIQKLFTKYEIENTDFMLYQKLIKMNDDDISAMDYQIIVLDEYHHNTAKIWGTKVKCLMASHASTIFFGTSATPIRSDGVNVIQELFDNNCVNELTLSQAIAKKIVPVPTYISALYTLDDELEILKEKIKNSTNTEEDKKEFYKKINAMRSNIEKGYGMPIVLNKHIKNKEGKYLVFCKNKSHLSEIKNVVIDWFKTAGFKNINDYTVHSTYENKDDEYNAFCNDTSHNLKLLFCVNMLNEGLHLDNISGVLLLRPTNSSIVWHQQIGRAIEANNVGNPVIIDATNNFMSIGYGINLLKDIKEAIRIEKKGNIDYVDFEFDIDTFFVTAYVQDVQKMFAEIEDRLQGNFELYLKALRQYKEREGDCLVKMGYIEVMDNENRINLGSWVSCMRQAKTGNMNYILTENMIERLNKVGFVWNALDYKFKNNVDKCVKFYDEENKRLPSRYSKDMRERKLGLFLSNEKHKIKTQENYLQWKINLLKQIPTFFNERENKCDKFYRNILLYREKYGHVNIKQNEEIDGYKIGYALSDIRKDYKNNKLSKEQIERLQNLGVDIICKSFEEQFRKTFELAKQALNEGVVISRQNQRYKEKNLYNWFRAHKDKFTKEEFNIMNKLVPNNNEKPVKIVDIKENRIYNYSSITEASRALCNQFHVVGTENGGLTAIYNYFKGKTKNPLYKERFRFEYADPSDTYSA